MVQHDAPISTIESAATSLDRGLGRSPEDFLWDIGVVSQKVLDLGGRGPLDVGSMEIVHKSDKLLGPLRFRAPLFHMG